MLFARLIKASRLSILSSRVSSGYVLSNGTVSSLIASLGFIPIIDDTALFNLFTAGSKFLTKFRHFFMVLEFLGIHRFKQQMFQHFVTTFHRGRMGMPVFCCCSSNINIVFFKELCHFTFKLLTVINLENLGIFERTTFLINCSQHRYNLA